MNKILLNTKLSTPSKLVRKVWSRSSNTLKETEEQCNSTPTDVPKESKKRKKKMSPLELEISNLREQVGILQLTIAKMQEDADRRDKAVADLANEKQQLTIDLRKEKRSTTSIQKQLEEEREYYYKEKEQYCQEMNDCKKLKKKLKEKENRRNDNDSPQVADLKNQISKLKEVLQQTLEVNYNLSVKFLRMKNTKVDLRNRLKNQESNHEQAMQDLEKKISNIKIDIANVVDKRFLLPISPSNKKFLQIIKQNGVLMHENLCHQMEIDRLAKRMEYFKAIKLQHDLKKRLKCVYNVTHVHKDPIQTTTTDQLPEKLEKEQSTPKVKKSNNSKSRKPKPSEGDVQEVHKTKSSVTKLPQVEKRTSSSKVIKIYERNETVDTPKIIMLPEYDYQRSGCSSRDLQHLHDQDPKGGSSKPDSSQTYFEIPKSNSISRNSSRTFSGACTSVSKEALRTQSAPEIVQTSLYVNSRKP